MSSKDIIDIIFEYRSDIWQHWMILVTLNIAMWGWLLQRNGLYGVAEKLVSTVGYSAFVLIIISGMNTSYKILDLATNELFALHEENEIKISAKGIINHLITKSPEFCEKKVAKTNKKTNCSPYSQNLNIALIFILTGWIFSMILFWYKGFWESVLRAKKT